MITVDLCSNPDRRNPAEALLRLAVEIARAKPEVEVRIPVGPCRRDRAVIDGELLADDGIEVY